MNYSFDRYLVSIFYIPSTLIMLEMYAAVNRDHGCSHKVDNLIGKMDNKQQNKQIYNEKME